MFQFPPSPTPNQTFTPVAGVTYRWSGTAWHLIAGPGAFLTAADADVRYVNIDEAQNTTNRIINGKMAIDQRNAGAAMLAATATAGQYALDRWKNGVFNGAGTFNMIRNADGLNSGEFVLTIPVVAAVPTLAANELYMIGQSIEGNNVADLNWGSAKASPITIAFEIEMNITGSFSFRLVNATSTRSYVVPFTINAANTREQKVFTIPGDTTGTWEKGSLSGLEFNLILGTGSTYVTATPNTWLATNSVGVAGQTNFMSATAGRTLYLRNVRLYKGSVDFGPDRRLYAEELALCQRYYEKSYNVGTAPGAPSMIAGADYRKRVQSGSTETITMYYRTPKRAAPSVTFYNHSTGAVGTWFCGTGVATMAATVFGENCFVADATGGVVGDLLVGHWTSSSEL